MHRQQIENAINYAYTTPVDELIPQLRVNPLTDNTRNGVRPFSASISDGAFGDSGKGSVTDTINELLIDMTGKPLHTMRYNGSNNAGHDIIKRSGLAHITHSLPVGSTNEGAFVYIARTCGIHPNDLFVEHQTIAESYGGKLPGTLLVDPGTLIGTDLHRAYEYSLQQWHRANSNSVEGRGGQGATGNGVGPMYADKTLRQSLNLGNLLTSGWQEDFRRMYQFYRGQINGLRQELGRNQMYLSPLPDMLVKRFNGLSRDDVPVGSETQFIDNLASSRDFLKTIVSSDFRERVRAAWQDPTLPFTFEQAQGPGLHPWHGVCPDNTSSEPITHTVIHATYGIVDATEIAMRVGVIKPYISSVGTRRLPQVSESDTCNQDDWIRDTFSERGKTTGRDRDIYPIDPAMLNYFRRVDGYQYLAPTHLDAARVDLPTRVITHLTHRTTGKAAEYYPQQDVLDKLIAHVVNLPGWDGEAAKHAKNIQDLPENALRFLALIEKTNHTPVVLIKNGQAFKNHLFNLPKRS